MKNFLKYTVITLGLLIVILFTIMVIAIFNKYNKNSVPNDTQSPFVTSGIRLGTAAITTRGFKESETKVLGNLICDVLDDIENESNINSVKEKILNLTSQFPVYATSKKAVA